jgi:hypothetical protein
MAKATAVNPFRVVSARAHIAAVQFGVLEEEARAMRERATMQALAPAHAVSELEIPVGRHLRRGGKRLLARGSDDQFSLDVGASEDLGNAVAAFGPQLPDVERGQRFRLVVAGSASAIYFGKSLGRWESVVKCETSNCPTRKWRNWQTHQLEGLAVVIPSGFKSPLPHQT